MPCNVSFKTFPVANSNVHAAFQPPRDPVGMKVLLEHSVQTYGPLPSELHPRRVRSRTSSRVSPYPQGRTIKVSLSPQQSRGAVVDTPRAYHALQDVSLNPNLMSPMTVLSPSVIALKANKENASRPRVASNARRTALGWSKRPGKTSTDLKENAVNTSQGSIMMTCVFFLSFSST